ncbi:MAG: N-acetyltransferase family protein [Chloroflexota bacterium]
MMSITHAMLEDWPDIRQIYIEGIRTGHATFQKEEEVLGIEQGAEWFAGKIENLRFKVMDDDESMLGWAMLSLVSSRPVYAGVTEVSIYLGDNARGRGIGTLLLQHLIRESEAAGIWTLQAGIFPENKASIRLHENCGFRILGIREKLGKMNGEWRDVAFMERRSTVVL